MMFCDSMTFTEREVRKIVFDINFCCCLRSQVVASDSSLCWKPYSDVTPFDLRIFPWWSLCTLYSSQARWSYRRQIGSLLLCACSMLCLVNCSSADDFPLFVDLTHIFRPSLERLRAQSRLQFVWTTATHFPFWWSDYLIMLSEREKKNHTTFPFHWESIQFWPDWFFTLGVGCEGYNNFIIIITVLVWR